MPKQSAGLLVYRKRDHGLEFLLVHPGGPFWKNKDAGSWTIPKGEIASGEAPLDTALREFKEELGLHVTGPFTALIPIKQKAGKIVQAWAGEADLDLSAIVSNTFEMEWPPRSGRMAQFPEIDRAEYFELETAKIKINPAQIPFLDQAAAMAKLP